MNRDARDIAGLHNLLSISGHRRFLNRSLNASILACEDKTVMPPGFFLECEIAFSVVSQKKPLIAGGLIELPRRELNLEKLIEKKRREYYTVSDKFQSLFDDVKVQMLSASMPVFVPRETKIGETAATSWREKVDTAGQLEHLKAALESASVTAIRDAPMLVVERGDALTYEALKPHLPDEVLGSSELFRRHLQDNYFMLYVDEFDLFALRKLPQFFDFFALPSQGLAHSFQSIENTLSALGLEWLLEAAPHLLVKIKRRSGFINFFDAYHRLGIVSHSNTDMALAIDEAAKGIVWKENIAPSKRYKTAGVVENSCTADELMIIDQYLGELASIISSRHGIELRSSSAIARDELGAATIPVRGGSKSSSQSDTAPVIRSKRTEFPADRIVSAISPDGMSGLFLLGTYDNEKTVHTQQRRALSVAHALAETSEVVAASKVAIVGAGVGGVVAGYALALIGADVTVFEEKKSLIPYQLGNTTRFIHPNIYDWPLLGSTTLETNLPFLNWTAGRSSDVAKVITKQFEEMEDATENLRWRPETTITSIEPLQSSDTFKRVELSSEDGGVNEVYDAVILATGFGLEYGDLGGVEIYSYWDNDGLENLLYGRNGEPQRILVSGAGDGGLTDLMRATIEDFDQGVFIKELSNNPDLLALRQPILDSELAAKRAQRGRIGRRQQFNFSEFYQKLGITQIVAKTLEGRIRNDTDVHFNFQQAPRLNASSSCLNRIIIETLIQMGAVKPKQGDFRKAKIEKSGAVWEIEWTPNSRPQHFDKIVVRHGPKYRTGVIQFPNVQNVSSQTFSKIAELDLNSDMHPETLSFFWNLLEAK